MNAFVVVALACGVGHADPIKVPRAAKTAALHQWTPIQQYFPDNGSDSSDRYEFGYKGAYGAIVMADELGDHLSALGLLSLVDMCFHQRGQPVKPDVSEVGRWAVCGADVNAVDLAKVEAELTAAGVEAADRKQILEDGRALVENAKKVGAAVEAAAKDDKGIAAIIALGHAGRTEWEAFASKNKDQIALLDNLQDAIRSDKNGLGGDCLKTTQPPFAKLVKATHFSESSGHPLTFYVESLQQTTEGYITTLTYAACAAALTEKGKGIYTVAANSRLDGGTGDGEWMWGIPARRGPRSVAFAKMWDASFKPKFADRQFSLGRSLAKLRGDVSLPGANGGVGGESQGAVAAMKKGDENTSIAFGGNTVDECVDWREVRGEKVCKKRAMVPNQETATEIPNQFTAGITKGVSVIIAYGFPVVAWKGKTLTAVLGTATK